MNNLDVMFSKKSDIWSTPQDLSDKLDNEFHFNIDVCANDSNHKCSKYFTEQDDGLSKDWHGTVQMNPPYSACKDQIRKAFESSAGGQQLLLLFRRGQIQSGFTSMYSPILVCLLLEKPKNIRFRLS